MSAQTYDYFGFKAVQIEADATGESLVPPSDFYDFDSKIEAEVNLGDRYYAYLQEYLLENLEPKHTAGKLTWSINKKLTDGEYGDFEDTLERLWDSFNYIVYQIPYDHPYMAKLVALVTAIKQLPPPQILDNGNDDLPSCAKGLWKDLPLLGACMSGEWDQMMPWGERVPEFGIQGWTSFNSFLARLTAASVIHIQHYTIRTLRDSLEHPNELYRLALDNLVPAAATWILYNGLGMFRNRTQWVLRPGTPSHDDDEKAGYSIFDFSHQTLSGQDVGRAGVLYEAITRETQLSKNKNKNKQKNFSNEPATDKGFSPQRWMFWKSRFHWVEGKKSLRKVTRRFAGDAYRKMEEIERAG